MDVFLMENPIKMDDLGGFTTPIFGNTQMGTMLRMLQEKEV